MLAPTHGSLAGASGLWTASRSAKRRARGTVPFSGRVKRTKGSNLCAPRKSGQSPDRYDARHDVTGLRAARTSSGRLIGVVCGASCSSSAGSSRDAEQRLGEGVERLLALGLGRLDHHAPRGRSAGSRPSGRGSRSPAAAWRCPWPRCRARPCSLRGRGDELVHAAVAVRHGQDVLHARQQVVGVEHGVLGDAPQAVRARACGCSSRRAPARRRCRRSSARGRSTWAGRSRGGSRRRRATTTRRGQVRRQLLRPRRSGPAPGPPPPCGPLKVLCGLKCIMSAPKSPGRVMPRMAFMFAPSR